MKTLKLKLSTTKKLIFLIKRNQPKNKPIKKNLRLLNSQKKQYVRAEDD